MVVVLIDFAGGYGLVAGPRSAPEVCGDAGWQYGVTIGLTPSGTSSILGVTVRELAGRTVALEDLLGHRAAELAGRLAGSTGWPARFGLADDYLSAWVAQQPPSDGPVTRAWRRLEGSAGRIRIGALAEDLGVSRRYLEIGFGRQIGMPPKMVARIARFQHAVHALSQPSARFSAAAACGFADQSHFNREFRALAGITPTELFAFLQYTRPLAD